MEDPDTLLSDGRIDPAKITFRVMGMTDGTLQSRLASDSDTWTDIPLTDRTQYREFSLTHLRGGLVAFSPNAGVSTLTFQIQAVDGAPNLSDSDRNGNRNDADPASVSIWVVALKEITAGKEMPVNDESGDGALTPSDATLGVWMGAATSSQPRVLVTLHDRRFGEELFLQDRHGIGTITSSRSWDADTGTATLSLQSNGSATTDDFQAVLNALALRTVRSAFPESKHYPDACRGEFRPMHVYDHASCVGAEEENRRGRKE